MTLEYLSNKELYYSENINEGTLTLIDDEYKHAAKVMRHFAGEQLFVTDGKGNIYDTIISEVKKDCITADIFNKNYFENKLQNIIFCVPRLKSPERFEFALEKCTELGITRFIVFNAERSIAKGSKIERWNKIVLSAMKQSLNCYLPKINLLDNLKQIRNDDTLKILFEQNTQHSFSSFINIPENDYSFIFGPEGGLSDNELSLFEERIIFNLAENRLRAETAIIKAASLL